MIIIRSSFFFITVFFCFTCFAQPLSQAQTVKAEELKLLYINAFPISDKNKEAQKKFFSAFPSSFEELNELYGWNTKSNLPAILYSEAEDHINLFNNLPYIDETMYDNKIIKIAINGAWDADAINYFQKGLIEKVFKNPALFAKLLQKLPRQQIESFWLFFFDSPVPEKAMWMRQGINKEKVTNHWSKNSLPPALENIQQTDKEVYNIMLASYKKKIAE